jgi:predicted Fe-Mo cluster-binding NifX family protein
MKIIIIPNFGTRISPRLDFAESLNLFKIKNGKVIESEVLKFIAHNRLERINMLVELRPDVIICDGISQITREQLTKEKICVIPWTHGEISEVIEMFLLGKIQASEKDLGG